MGEPNESEEKIAVDPLSDRGKVLNFLAVNSDEKFSPEEISEELDVSEVSSTRAMRGLERDGLVEFSEKSYFVPKKKLGSVRDLILGSWVKKVVESLPEENIVWDEPDSEAIERAEEIVEEILED